MLVNQSLRESKWPLDRNYINLIKMPIKSVFNYFSYGFQYNKIFLISKYRIACIPVPFLKLQLTATGYLMKYVSKIPGYLPKLDIHPDL